MEYIFRNLGFLHTHTWVLKICLKVRLEEAKDAIIPFLFPFRLYLKASFTTGVRNVLLASFIDTMKILRRNSSFQVN